MTVKRWNIPHNFRAKRGRERERERHKYTPKPKNKTNESELDDCFHLSPSLAGSETLSRLKQMKLLFAHCDICNFKMLLNLKKMLNKIAGRGTGAKANK